MSETQYEEPVYVVSKRRRASEAVVHMPDCEKIHHQVEQDVRPAVHRETRVPAYIRFVANYMTLTELRNIGFRYHPCGYCQPPVPTVDGPIPISVKARNLNVTHLGKEFIGRGVLESFSITGRLNDDGSRTVTTGSIRKRNSNTFAPTRNDERFRTADHPERNASLPVDDFEKLFSCLQWFGISVAA